MSSGASSKSNSMSRLVIITDYYSVEFSCNCCQEVSIDSINSINRALCLQISQFNQFEASVELS